MLANQYHDARAVANVQPMNPILPLPNRELKLCELLLVPNPNA